MNTDELATLIFALPFIVFTVHTIEDNVTAAVRYVRSRKQG